MKPRSFVFALAIAVAMLSPGWATGAGEVRPFVRGSWQEIRTAHEGRPVIVHLWGLTCAPCRVEMPEWGKLLQEKPAVDLITIHADRLPPNPRLVVDMLANAGLQTADNWMFADTFQERLRYEIDPKWRGELPMTLLIGRDGATQVTVGPANIETVRNWIQGQAGAPR